MVRGSGVLFAAFLLLTGFSGLWAEGPVAAPSLSSRTIQLRDQLRREPQNDRVRSALAKSLFEDGRYVPAAKLWGQILKRRGNALEAPIRASLARKVAISLHRAGMSDKALRFARIAQKAQPEDPAVIRLVKALEGRQASTQVATVAPTPDPTPAATQASTPSNVIGVPVNPGTEVADDGSSVFLRLSPQDADGEHGALEVAHVTYVAPDGKTKVTLQGVTHIGAQEFYDTLQQRLEGYDAVLYEAVTLRPGDAPVAPPEATPADVLAIGMKLASQIRVMDMQRPNFVWADLAITDIADRGGPEAVQSLATALTLKPAEAGSQQAADAAAAQAQQMQDMVGMNEEEQLMYVRGTFAKRLAGEIDALGDQLGEGSAEVILTWRNERVMEVLQWQIEQTPGANIAVLYGAAHMKDLEARLREMGYKPDTTQWDVVWEF